MAEDAPTLQGVRITRALYDVEVRASIEGAEDQVFHLDREIWQEMARQIVSLEGGHEREAAYERGVRDTLARLTSDEAVERAARALCVADPRHADALARGDTDEDHPVILARAALAAAFVGERGRRGAPCGRARAT